MEKPEAEGKPYQGRQGGDATRLEGGERLDGSGAQPGLNVEEPSRRCRSVARTMSATCSPTLILK